MRVKKIVMRTGVGLWSVPVENKSKTHCDHCGEKLWGGPGRMVYCDSKPEKHSVQFETDPMYLVAR